MTATATGSHASINPLRYRGYYYDTETGLYYLQSRYYDPAIGRFISCDEFASTGQGILGYNMFAYCGNDPLNYCDSVGYLPVAAMAFGAATNVATTFIAAKITNQDYTARDCMAAAFSGAVNPIGKPGKIASGVVCGVYTAYSSHKSGTTWGYAVLCGVTSGVLTSASASNIASLAGMPDNITIGSVTDLVFGLGNNAIAATTYYTVNNKSTQIGETHDIDDMGAFFPDPEQQKNMEDTLYKKLTLMEKRCHNL